MGQQLPLSEVIPELKTSANLMNNAGRILVERTVLSKDRTEIRFYIVSPVLLEKRDIFTLEAAIKRCCFGSRPVTVRVHERFELPDGPLEDLIRAYLPSMELELRTRQMTQYTLLRKASWSFPDAASARLNLPDSLLTQHGAAQLCEYVRDLLKNRFGRENCSISWGIEETAGTAGPTLRAAQDDEMARTIKEISERYLDVEEQAAEQRALELSVKKAQADRKARYAKRRRLEPSEGFGTAFDGGDVTPIKDITEAIGEVTVEGQVFDLESRTVKSGNLLYAFAITDRTDSIRVKVFCKPEEKPILENLLVSDGPAKHVRLHGVAAYDTFDKEIAIVSVSGMIPLAHESRAREDRAPVKRVELHAHTQMSEMDAVTHVDEYIKRAAAWGHKAVAITDHGVVQAFPDALHTAEKLKGKIKIIYGCEGYLFDDTNGRNPDAYRDERYHVILLAKNETGRINLYRLVSEAHLKYFKKRPRIPKSLLTECREGLIVSSACQAGEVFQALLRGESEEELARLVNFYDYLEVQPLKNNAFLLRDPHNKTEEDLRDYTRRIVELGEQYGKRVVATCDVHFLDPEDEVYRRIIQKGLGFKDADEQPPLYFRTTEEMMEEFAFLGHDKAEEIVITNSNWVADQCEVISPVRPDKCPPRIEGSEEELRTMCEARAAKLYGDPLPEIVRARLEKELKSIIGNGFAVMYIIAQRLVKKSNDDGYLVGSRGSVGSSFVATMAGITEVNPLPPHYRCPRCRHSIFDNEETRAHAGGAGVDMKDMNCPVCGEKMIKDGYDIPFETFLGFKGNKEPDIDLNFSGEYQSRAHEYTEVLFGKGNTFKAGTISGVAEKTAYGFALKYFEEKGIVKRRCEIERIAQGMVGTRRTTGQHPGGIVVKPDGENIYSFTPIQHPANDMSSKIVTTHFDYHSIDHNLLKLDILGHDDPTMIRRLEDLIGIDATKIPLDDPQVIRLFKNTEPLKISSDQIGGCPLGTLGVPEFGTDFAMGIVQDAKPTCLADLVRIAGIAHGTDVWLGNVQDLITSGTATLGEAICTRDDIMLYLISKGLEPALSFSIMESVRKGKVAKGQEGSWPQWKEQMAAHSVPDWYIGSCEKIQYMFPKAHAAAYVMMAWRVAYCKVYYPLEYYTAYFTVRGDGFDYELICLGHEAFARHLANFRRNADNLSDTEAKKLRDMRIVEEMFARGFDFAPIDLYRAQATRFQIVDGKIMPSFNSIAGMGEKAAQSLEEAAAQGRFLSREDLAARAKISSTLVDQMARMGILGDMPMTNQLSLLDIEFL